MQTTPCGLVVPYATVFRDAAERAFVVATGNGIPGGSTTVALEDNYVPWLCGDRWPLIPQVEACSEAWLRWHDEHCDCRAQEA